MFIFYCIKTFIIFHFRFYVIRIHQFLRQATEEFCFIFHKNRYNITVFYRLPRQFLVLMHCAVYWAQECFLPKMWPGLESENSFPYIANDESLWICTANSFIFLLSVLSGLQEGCLHSLCLYFHANNVTLSVLSLVFKQRTDSILRISELH